MGACQICFDDDINMEIEKEIIVADAVIVDAFRGYQHRWPWTTL